MDISMSQKQGRNRLRDASKAQMDSEVAYMLNSSWILAFILRIPQLCVSPESHTSNIHPDVFFFGNIYRF